MTLQNNKSIETFSAINKGRDMSIDVAKGIGILIVIAGHTNLGMAATFHMAFFFLLSGYFMTSKLSEKEFAIKRAKQLLVPYVFGVFMTVVGSIIKNLFYKEYVDIVPDIQKWIIAGLYGKGTKKDILFEGVHKIGAYWFLLAMFLGSIIVRKYIDNKYMLAIVAIIAYVGWATRQVVFLPLSIQNGLVASFFIGAGVYARKLDLFHKKCDPLLMVGMSALWIFAIYNKIYMSMSGISFPNGLLNVIIAFVASYLVVKFSQVINEKTNWIRKVLVFYGQNSLIVLCFHALEINIIRWPWCYKIAEVLGIGELGALVIIFISRTIFCTLGVFIVNKSKCLRKIFAK